MKIIFLYTRHWTTDVGPLKWFGQNCTTELPNIQQVCTRVLQIKIVLLCKYFLQGSWWKCWKIFFQTSFVSFGLRCSNINYRRRLRTQQFRKPNNCLRRERCIYLHLPCHEFSLEYNSFHGGWSPLSPWQLYMARHTANFVWVVLLRGLERGTLYISEISRTSSFSPSAAHFFFQDVTLP